VLNDYNEGKIASTSTATPVQIERRVSTVPGCIGTSPANQRLPTDALRSPTRKRLPRRARRRRDSGIGESSYGAS
jgi:hypothetical protein